ncbi:hypothetical protein A1O7_03931 [Cladophialophora yegresii CBS 114405]|uniref:Uncharacterized protein n=1 Tax=Cladophialophora yegresii CBS 114405 TaxID=1182544 RepID=W9WMW7_9EURO|nr:uncharacterized protein A1O7_03931 [Cladophialophora yegresii CBS 114405]EXJ59784.1 hypothetical protein A1O7_03931 [Cladophialophora yegresii CBS 114405]
MAPLKPAERLNFFLQLQHPLRNTLLDKYQDSRLQGFRNLRDPKAAMDQLMARILTSNNPTEVVFQTPLPALPFFFIDEPSNTHILLHVNRDTPFGHFSAILREASADIATQIKNNAYLDNGGTICQASATHFTWDDGPYLYRIATVTQGPGGQELVARTEWETLYTGTYLELFDGPHARQIGSRVEIQHTLQHFRSLSATGGDPPPSPPPSPVAGRPVVRLPPVSSPAVAPLRVVPVSSTSRAGVLVVDGGDLAWYNREAVLRGWLRFGSAEVVESVDVWSGW